jgi:hypothetical protein
MLEFLNRLFTRALFGRNQGSEDIPDGVIWEEREGIASI